MGGKTWSRDEELFFWRTIIPMSAKAAVELTKPVDWEQLAAHMQQHFGDHARRKYTQLMLYEHYFQNVTTGHESPRASDLVAEHRRALKANGRDPDDTAPMESKPSSRRASRKKKAKTSTKTSHTMSDRSSPQASRKAESSTRDVAESSHTITLKGGMERMHPGAQESECNRSSTRVDMNLNSFSTPTRYSPPTQCYQRDYCAHNSFESSHERSFSVFTNPYALGSVHLEDMNWNISGDSGYASTVSSTMSGASVALLNIPEENHESELSVPGHFAI